MALAALFMNKIIIFYLLCIACIAESCSVCRRLFNVNNEFEFGYKSGAWTEVDSLGMLNFVSYCHDTIVDNFFSINPNRLCCDTDCVNCIRNGVRSGVWVEFCSPSTNSETLLELVRYKHGVKNGKYVIISYPANEMREKGRYKNGFRNRWCSFYFGNGSLMGRCKYRNGFITRRSFANPKNF